MSGISEKAEGSVDFEKERRKCERGGKKATIKQVESARTGGAGFKRKAKAGKRKQKVIKWLESVR